ncbi:MAG: MbtH-like NRPS chaperone, partial [uncultured Corynebacteriales bacterium]
WSSTSPSSTTRASTRCGGRTGTCRPAGGRPATAAPGRSAWPGSTRCGPTCGRSACAPRRAP